MYQIWRGMTDPVWDIWSYLVRLCPRQDLDLKILFPIQLIIFQKVSSQALSTTSKVPDTLRKTFAVFLCYWDADNQSKCSVSASHRSSTPPRSSFPYVSAGRRMREGAVEQARVPSFTRPRSPAPRRSRLIRFYQWKGETRLGRVFVWEK